MWNLDDLKKDLETRADRDQDLESLESQDLESLESQESQESQESTEEKFRRFQENLAKLAAKIDRDDNKISINVENGEPNYAKTFDDYQLRAIKDMIRMEDEKEHSGGILALDMGMGKTIVSAALIKLHYTSRTKTLLVVPKSTVDQWRAVLDRFDVDHDVVLTRKKRSVSQKRCVLTTFSLFRAGFFQDGRRVEKREALKALKSPNNTIDFGIPEHIKEARWSRIMVDEAHNMRNKNSLLFHAISSLSRLSRSIIAKWAITATVVNKNEGDISTVAKWIGFDPRFKESSGDSGDSGESSGEKYGVWTPIYLRMTIDEEAEKCPALQYPGIEVVCHAIPFAHEEERSVFVEILDKLRRKRFKRENGGEDGEEDKEYTITLEQNLLKSCIGSDMVSFYDKKRLRKLAGTSKSSKSSKTLEYQSPSSRSLSPDSPDSLDDLEDIESIGSQECLPVTPDFQSGITLNSSWRVQQETTRDDNRKPTSKMDAILMGLRESDGFDVHFKNSIYSEKDIEWLERSLNAQRRPCSYDRELNILSSTSRERVTNIKIREDGRLSYDIPPVVNEILRTMQLGGNQNKRFLWYSNFDDEENRTFARHMSESGLPCSFVESQDESQHESQDESLNLIVGIESFTSRWKPKYVVDFSSNIDVVFREINSRLDVDDKNPEIARRIGKSSKVDHIIKILRNEVGNEKFVVFTKFKEVIEPLMSRLELVGISTDCYHGGMKNRQRESAISNFKTDKVRGIIIQIDAGGSGLNLQEAQLVFNLTTDWSPCVEFQAVGRVHRRGQKNPVKYHRIVIKNTIEDHCLRIQQDKLNVIRHATKDDAMKVKILDHKQIRKLSTMNLENKANLSKYLRKSMEAYPMLPTLSQLDVVFESIKV